MVNLKAARVGGLFFFLSPSWPQQFAGIEVVTIWKALRQAWLCGLLSSSSVKRIIQYGTAPKKLEVFMPRDDLGRFVPGTSGNPGGRPKPPDGLRTRLAELSPHAVERLGELLNSGDERVRLEAAKAILDRHLGRPAIQADISLHRDVADGHLAALLEVARRRTFEPIVLEDVEIEILTPPPSMT